MFSILAALARINGRHRREENAPLVEPSTIEQNADSVPADGFVAKTFSSLRHRNYRHLFVGTVFMSAGQWIQNVTLGWLVYDLTASSMLLGMLNGLRAVPFLITSPIAGVVANRIDRKNILIVCQYVLMLTAASMGILVAAGFVRVWQVFTFTLITAVAWRSPCWWRSARFKSFTWRRQTPCYRSSFPIIYAAGS